MLPGSHDVPALSLSVSPTISMAHLLKPCISECILILSPHFTYCLPGKKKSGLEVIFFDNAEHNCSIVIWLSEVLPRSMTPDPACDLSPSSGRYRISFCLWYSELSWYWALVLVYFHSLCWVQGLFQSGNLLYTSVHQSFMLFSYYE